MSTEISAWGEEGRRQYDDDGRPITSPTTCGVCGRTWDDALITSLTPIMAGRCPFEYDHEYDDDYDEKP